MGESLIEFLSKFYDKWSKNKEWSERRYNTKKDDFEKSISVMDFIRYGDLSSFLQFPTNIKRDIKKIRIRIDEEFELSFPNLLKLDRYKIKKQINQKFHPDFPAIVVPNYKTLLEVDDDIKFKFNVLLKNQTINDGVDDILRYYPNFKGIKKIKIQGVSFIELTLSKGERFYDYTMFHEEDNDYTLNKLYSFVTSNYRLFNQEPDELINCLRYYDNNINSDPDMYKMKSINTVTCYENTRDLNLIISPDIFFSYFERLYNYDGFFSSQYLCQYGFGYVSLTGPVAIKPIVQISIKHQGDEEQSSYYRYGDDIDEYFTVKMFD
jgi:hypothetical protein